MQYEGSAESKLITYKDIAAPAKQGDPNIPAQPKIADMFDQPIGCAPFGPIPSFDEPDVAPYTGGFNLSALHQVLEYQAHTSQDMSTLVLDNAQFRGEAMDEQDKQWYTHMHVDSIVNTEEQDISVTASSSSTGPPIQATVQSDFADFSSRGRKLGRMSSEQALDYSMNQHNAGPSH